jgi:PAS domain-containing protein
MSDSLHVFNNPYSELNLQTSIKKYQLYNVFMLAPAILCILKGPDHILELANDPFRQLIGNRNPIGQTLKEALPEIEGQGYFEILDKVYKTGEPFSGKEMPVYINRNDKRELVYLNLNYQVFLNDNETIEGILVFAYDVTEQVNSRHKIQENESKYRDLIYSLPAALYTCDKEGYIQLYNAAAVKL